MPKEAVAIVRIEEQRIDEALQKMVELLGGLDDLGIRGSTVIVKPNLTFAPTHKGITHTEAVEGVVRLLADLGAGNIIIAESSGDTYTSQAFRLQGLYRVAARYGASVVDLNLEEGIRTAVDPALGRDYVMVPRAMAEADLRVSVPIYKLWGGSPLSLSLKNYFGCYGGRYYGYNKNSREMVDEHDSYGLPGEIGTELGAHMPNVPKSICAVNTAVKTDLAIVDAIEGGDGGGNWIRLNTLIGGRNPVATDTVGLAMAGYDAQEYETFPLCSQHGLGPCDLDQIEVVGESIADSSFSLDRLRGNVLEMPAAYCLELLSTHELQQIQRGLSVYDLLPAEKRIEGYPANDLATADRQTLLGLLTEVLTQGGFFQRALDACPNHAKSLLALIAERGGTAYDLEIVRNAFSEQCGGDESLYYSPAARALNRMGLAYVVGGSSHSYFLLPEGLLSALHTTN